MLKKIKSFYKRNRVYSILMIISITCIIAILVGVIVYFLGQTSKDKYGNRLEGIENVKISDSKIKEIEDNIKNSEKVKEVEVDIRGKLIYIVITLNEGTHSDAESISQTSLETFGEEIRAFYDIQYIVDNNGKSEESFPIMGYIKSENSVIKWTNYAN